MDAQVAALAVAEKGSFEAAGRYLGIGKSAVRKRVLVVESELGTPVFRSSSTGMVPTEAGQLYLPSARESIRHAHLGLDRATAFVRAQSSKFRIGYSTYLNTKLLEVISRVEPRDIGRATITRESLLTHQAVTGVLEGELQLGFGRLPVSAQELDAVILMEEPLVACLPGQHRLATKSILSPEDVAEEPQVAVARRAIPGSFREIVEHFESLGTPLKIVADALSAKEALWLVSQGEGIALMTRFSASSYHFGTVTRPLADRLLTAKSGVFMRRGSGERFLKDLVKQVWEQTAVLRSNRHV